MTDVYILCTNYHSNNFKFLKSDQSMEKFGFTMKYIVFFCILYYVNTFLANDNWPNYHK